MLFPTNMKTIQIDEFIYYITDTQEFNELCKI